MADAQSHHSPCPYHQHDSGPIQSGNYSQTELGFETDWSSAAFFFQVCALSNDGELFLKGLKCESLQGDSALPHLFSKLNVNTSDEAEGVRINNSSSDLPSSLDVDFSAIPDLVQAFVMTCAALGVELTLRGLHNLHLKETDRIEALKYNLAQMGAELYVENEVGQLSFKGVKEPVNFKSFGDHRMAMSLAPLSLKFDRIEIDQIDVVSKSFPAFWKEMKKLGFEVG